MLLNGILTSTAYPQSSTRPSESHTKSGFQSIGGPNRRPKRPTLPSIQSPSCCTPSGLTSME